MGDYIMYVGMFIGIYLFYVFFVLLRKKQLEKFKKSPYILLLEKKYEIDLKKVNFKILAHMVCLANSFILATIVFIISGINNILLAILAGITVMIIATFLLYHLIGKLYGKKGK